MFDVTTFPILEFVILTVFAVILPNMFLVLYTDVMRFPYDNVVTVVLPSQFTFPTTSILFPVIPERKTAFVTVKLPVVNVLETFPDVETFLIIIFALSEFTTFASSVFVTLILPDMLAVMTDAFVVCDDIMKALAKFEITKDWPTEIEFANKFPVFKIDKFPTLPVNISVVTEFVLRFP
ncbi:hypothetical protein PBCV1_a030R [Paramecium bursaria Chlorella virus 1]|uniref:Uncharacterized protein n=1 Tax=Paramecium bursaria Chlorella virus 1 TaxID=10506 RepID=Q89365_PBCV1|nr:hypothetical protein PBCV1_a030R [Paramecium bursaria Chlorella virus 1]AAC96398.1 hypothetical protein [Paramecium bursaria Chlorella virus 1]